MVGEYWGQLANLAARRNSEAIFVDRQVRGETWTFVHNNVSGDHLRINDLVRQVVHQLDGKTTLQSILEQVAVGVDKDERESLAVAMIALSQLGAIRFCDDAEQERLLNLAAHKQSRRMRAWQNPLAVRIPLHDPDEWISRWVGALKPWLTGHLLTIVLLTLAGGLVLAVTRLPEIRIAAAQLASTPAHWWQMLLLYPLLKCLHELAHAIAIKRFNGEVHEVGITLLVLMPIPYVDASDIWRFERRRDRIIVCAAGMLAEGFVSACAFVIWCLVEPGIVSDLAFVTAVLGAVSSLMFNANPLLKFDGYQILQDLIDIPNLAPRAGSYLTYLLRRYILLIRNAASPVTAVGERRWLFGYGVSALLYRWIITFGIAFYLISVIPVLGAFLALFAIFQLTIKPLFRAIKYLFASPELACHRGSSVFIATTLCAVLTLLVFLMPVPTNTRAEGIVWAPEQIEVYSPESAEIEDIHVENGQQVELGQVLFTLSAPELHTRVSTLSAEIETLSVARQSLQRNDLVSAQSLKQDIRELQSKLDEIHRRVSSLTVRASREGRLQLFDEQVAKGRYVSAGDTLANVVGNDPLIVKTVISQHNIARLATGVRAVSVRLAESFDQPLNGQLLRHIPAGNRSLPSQSLAFDGRSGIAVASTDENQWQTVDPVFHVEVSLQEATTVGIGGRAYVRFSHESESIGKRSVRVMRQLLLKRLSI